MWHVSISVQNSFLRMWIQQNVDGYKLRCNYRHKALYFGPCVVPTSVLRPRDCRNKSRGNKKLKAVKLLQPRGR
jgi:hypothetical protein